MISSDSFYRTVVIKKNVRSYVFYFLTNLGRFHRKQKNLPKMARNQKTQVTHIPDVETGSFVAIKCICHAYAFPLQEGVGAMTSLQA